MGEFGGRKWKVEHKTFYYNLRNIKEIVLRSLRATLTGTSVNHWMGNQ